MKTTREIYESYIKDYDTWKNYEAKWYSEEEMKKILEIVRDTAIFDCDEDYEKAKIEGYYSAIERIEKELKK